MEDLRSGASLVARPLCVAVDKASPPHVYFTTQEQASRGTSPVVNTFVLQASTVGLTGTVLRRYGGMQGTLAGQAGQFHYPTAVVAK